MLKVEYPELSLLERELARSGGLFHGLLCLHPEQDRTSPAQSGATVLVVDDNEQTRSIAGRMLRDEGYRVIEAQSGEDALVRLVEAKDVQVVLTDIAMPGGMDGLELASKVTALAPWCGVVLMSGYSRIFPQLKTSELPYPLLLKPFSADQLAREIREVLKKELH